MKEKEYRIWCESVNKIDYHIAKLLYDKGWKALLPNGIDGEDEMKAFYMHIMYIINSFLEKGNEQRELFIQIPIEELANKDSRGRDSKQVKRFRWLIGTIAACLQMATVRNFKENLFVHKEDDYEDTFNHYRIGDIFFAKKDNGGSFYIEVIETNDERRSRLRFYNSQNLQKRSDPRAAFKECEPCPFVRISRIPTQLRNGVIQIEKTTETVNRIPMLSRQYRSASFVSPGVYSPVNESIIPDSEIFDFPVSHYSNYKQAICNNPDVIIVCGDAQYNRVAQAYRNSNAKKIIYIGSVAPFEGGVSCYPFTIREMYRYCSRKFAYSEPSMLKLSFPWLDNCQRKLEVILDNCINNDEYFTEEDKVNVLRKLLCSFSRYDFDAEQLQRIKNLYTEDNIEELFNLSIDVSDDSINHIYQWIRNLEFSEKNPKAKWLESHKATLVLGKYTAFRRDVKSLIGDNNTIIADDLSVNSFDERYPFILRHHLFAKVIALYYKYEEYARKKLENYINSEIGYYTSEVRKRLKTNIDFSSIPVDEQLPGWLDDFFEEDYYINQSIISQSDRCRVTFEDDTSDIIDGDIIVDLGEEGYNDINIREAKKGMVITYYKKPDNFEDLIAVCPKYAEKWKMISDYSNLWKSKFIESYNYIISQGQTKKQAILDLSVSCKLPKERVKMYVRENNNRFLGSKKEMRNVLNYLASIGLITDEEKKKIILAKSFNSQIPLEFGTSFKKELFDYFMRNTFKCPLLKVLSNNIGLSKNAILTSAIVKDKIIKSIKTANNNE